MHRFRRILVCVESTNDKSEAYAQAARLARHVGSHLTVVDVIRELPPFVTALLANAESLREQRCAERLRTLKEWTQNEEIPTKAKVLYGRTTHCLVREVLEGHHDLLVRDAHVEDGASLLFGSVDLRLLRNCPCPVWLVKPGHHSNYDRVLAAVDCQPTPQGDAMNRRILEMSTSFAASTGNPLQIVSVWQGLADLAPDLKDRESPNRLIEQTARETVERLLEQSHPNTYRVHFRKGVAGEAIPQVAAEIDADLIVMGTLGRSGISGLLIGNTAERVLREVNCSVLAVKPHEFISPIVPTEDHGTEDFSLSWAPA